ncbi:TadE/TadG family type IV pilus assembly protein [Pokkaliibacter sp. CJK22405]|uniref:TadE/TadG family type IV pilus assembly protein n=1 Tax=Pokkaliibacter sp. CJK22405 TaxID=3384615 RepID=UPI003984EC47
MMKRNRQRGAVAIEFVLLFPILFLLFYAIVNYGLIFAAAQYMQYSAEEGLRRSISYVDESCLYSDTGCTSANVRQEVLDQTRTVLGNVASGSSSTSLGSLFGQPLDSALAISAQDDASGNCCVLSLTYNYTDFPFVPPLMLPVPAQLSITANLDL